MVRMILLWWLVVFFVSEAEAATFAMGDTVQGSYARSGGANLFLPDDTKVLFDATAEWDFVLNESQIRTQVSGDFWLGNWGADSELAYLNDSVILGTSLGIANNGVVPWETTESMFTFTDLDGSTAFPTVFQSQGPFIVGTDGLAITVTFPSITVPAGTFFQQYAFFQISPVPLPAALPMLLIALAALVLNGLGVRSRD